ncbi:DNA alkylation repair protein, variant 2 [Balamuthia mandrillaris]
MGAPERPWRWWTRWQRCTSFFYFAVIVPFLSLSFVSFSSFLPFFLFASFLSTPLLCNRYVEQREFQLAAIDLALSNRKLWTPDLLTSTFEFMLRNKSWWDTVDAIASSLVGPLVKSQLELGQDEDEDEEEGAVKEERQEEEETEGKQKEKEAEQGELAEEHGEEEREGQYQSLLDVLDRWNHDENLWIRRTSIIYQLKYKHDTDTQRLFRETKGIARTECTRKTSSFVKPLVGRFASTPRATLLSCISSSKSINTSYLLSARKRAANISPSCYANFVPPQTNKITFFFSQQKEQREKRERAFRYNSLNRCKSSFSWS